MNKETPETRRYNIRNEVGSWLGMFLVTHDGAVTTISDYGNYSYWWGSTGMSDIREFLIKISVDYMLGKMAPQSEFDGEAAKKFIKEHILDLRRAGDLTKEEAREEWDLIENADFYDAHGFGYHDWCNSSSIEGRYEFYQSDTPKQAKLFAERVWPYFIAALKKELLDERNLLTSSTNGGKVSP